MKQQCLLMVKGGNEWSNTLYMSSGSLLQLNEYVVMAEHDVAPRVLIHLRDGAVQYPGRRNMQM